MKIVREAAHVLYTGFIRPRVFGINIYAWDDFEAEFDGLGIFRSMTPLHCNADTGDFTGIRSLQVERIACFATVTRLNPSITLPKMFELPRSSDVAARDCTIVARFPVSTRYEF